MPDLSDLVMFAALVIVALIVIACWFLIFAGRRGGSNGH